MMHRHNDETDDQTRYLQEKLLKLGTQIQTHVRGYVESYLSQLTSERKVLEKASGFVASFLL